MSSVPSGFRRTLQQSDFDRFAVLSGDDNPIHCDPEFAGRSHFGATVAHGMFLYGLIYRALGEALPGAGMLQLEQELMFPNPSFAHDDVEVLVTPLPGRGDGSRSFSTVVRKQAGGAAIVTAQGSARVSNSGGAAALAGANDAAADTGAAGGGDDELRGLRRGMRARAERTLSEADLADYAALTGDCNPLHHSDDWAVAHGFAGRLVPPPLLASLFSDLLGTRLPGRGTGWMKQALRFVAPAYVGERITAEVEIVRLRADKDLVNLSSVLTGADGRTICRGESLVLVRNLEAPAG
ncbi:MULTISPECIES: MaoC/PaaZ C-terminal domain-containing protein [unclassified Janthinobacterium]|uniref:MaoC/PaaZ C-terminal domain-containing protein n=1 Tax=unclassified Janthinobacterium TaxID=2610881 RepID=UPI00034BAD8D|nr:MULTISPECIES: MaoC/PaaZ C-terminal domain-containing protein [unclassified Janthinobacterium]MEC5163332.1 acyl dehydratase [Janthinobacterium sp. CG_S6]